MSNVVVLDNVEIRKDSEGRYCLNDLHKASGGAGKYKPNEWLRYSTAKDLIEELMAGNPAFKPLQISKGRYGGTYVCKQLVYSYSMWISPAFHLKVVEFFDRGQTQGVAVADHAVEEVLNDPFAFMEKLFTQAKILKAERDALAAKLTVAAPKALVFDAHVANHGENLTRFVRTLRGVNTSMVKSDLARLGYLYRLGGSYRVYAKYRDVLFSEKLNAGSPKTCYDIYPTAKGKETLTQLYAEGALTLKKGF